MKRIISRVMAFIILCSIMYVPADAARYEYDQLNRLKSAEFDNGGIVRFNYDAMGNMTKVTYVLEHQLTRVFIEELTKMSDDSKQKFISMVFLLSSLEGKESFVTTYQNALTLLSDSQKAKLELRGISFELIDLFVAHFMTLELTEEDLTSVIGMNGTMPNEQVLYKMVIANEDRFNRDLEMYFGSGDEGEQQLRSSFEKYETILKAVQGTRADIFIYDAELKTLAVSMDAIIAVTDVINLIDEDTITNLQPIYDSLNLMANHFNNDMTENDQIKVLDLLRDIKILGE